MILIIQIAHYTAVQPVPKTVPVPLTNDFSIHRPVSHSQTIQHVSTDTAVCIRLYGLVQRQGPIAVLRKLIRVAQWLLAIKTLFLADVIVY